jgi:hypothetical protein
VTTAGWLELVAGLIVVLASVYDLFLSVVLPRPAVNKFVLVRFMFLPLWRVWRWVGKRFSHAGRREAWLAAFGPIGVLLMFGVWAAAFVVGYALIVDGLRLEVKPVPGDFFESLYFSATTLVPLSYGDFVPVGLAARLVTIAESATGVGLAALVITLLFSLYEAFQRREESVVALDAMAGAPPSGVQILETAAERGMREELVKTFDDWREWSAAVLESHLAYPALMYFRSSHDNEAWLNSFGAVMDAATLVLTTVDEQVEGPARLMFTVGNHLVEDLAWSYRYHASDDPLVEREEFEQALARLSKAGYKCRSAETAWKDFATKRARYATVLNQLAERLAIIPAQWIGDRSYRPHLTSRGQPRRRR